MNVPKIKQDPRTCGPTALQMVLSYFGKDIPHENIVRAIGGINGYGVRTVKLADFARSEGFKVECLSFNKKLAKGLAEIRVPSKRDILKYINNKVPVILAVNSSVLYGGKTDTPGHFIVLTGFKDGVFKYNDPYDGESHEIDEEHLMFAWHNNVLDSSAYFLALWPEDKKIISV